LYVVVVLFECRISNITHSIHLKQIGEKENRKKKARERWRDAIDRVREQIRMEKVSEEFVEMGKQRRRSIIEDVSERAKLILEMRRMKDQWVVFVDNDDMDSANELDKKIKQYIERARKLRVDNEETKVYAEEKSGFVSIEDAKEDHGDYEMENSD